MKKSAFLLGALLLSISINGFTETFSSSTASSDLGSLIMSKLQNNDRESRDRSNLVYGGEDISRRQHGF